MKRLFTRTLDRPPTRFLAIRFEQQSDRQQIRQAGDCKERPKNSADVRIAIERILIPAETGEIKSVHSVSAGCNEAPSDDQLRQ
jgi:hypothetical protein